MDYTADIPSPDLFRKWCAITAISGALERRVWVETARRKLYPNLYTLLVASPGIGKTEAISYVEELWRAGRKLYVAPNNLTKAALLDALERSDRKIIVPGGIMEYHTLVIATDEFGVFAPAHDLEFFSVLSRIYDCPRVHSEERRHAKKELEIIHPQLTILSGVQPGFMASMLPDEAWQQGFCSRLIMVYAGLGVKVSLFKRNEPRKDLFKKLNSGMNSMQEVMGQLQWEPSAEAIIEKWHMEGMKPVPMHSKLQNYNQRRILHVLKLTMIACISRGEGLTISLEDVNRARDWLLEVEQVMPDVFREMSQKSDTHILQEMHYTMWKNWAANGQKPISEARLLKFLSERVPGEKTFRLLELAERTDMFARVAGSSPYSYIPKPLASGGLE